MISRLLLLVAAVASTARAQAPDSVFRSDGYGFVAEFRGDELRASEVTEISCIPSYTFRRAPARSRAGVTAYRMTDGPITFFVGPASTAGKITIVFADELAVLESALDTIFSGARSMRGLVIDVRVNGGGADPLGLAIASRLTAEPYTAYAKVARNDPREASTMTPAQPSVVRPSARPGFRGPVVELIGRYSISADETFTQALMGRRPPVARVGEHTQGVFSDVLSRRLPNGWRMGLPNELFLTQEGTSFDGPGIPPTIAVPYFPRSDLDGGRDGALERAIEETTKRAP